MMSTVIGGAMLPHAPQFFTMPETEDKANVEHVREVAADIGDKLRALKPDLWIIFSNDHAEQFFHNAAPPFTVHVGGEATGEFAGRKFHWKVPSEIGFEIVRQLYRQNFDPAFTRTAKIDYAIGIPLTHIGHTEPVLPIYVNAYLPPQPTMERCYAFGQAVARTVTALGLEDRHPVERRHVAFSRHRPLFQSGAGWDQRVLEKLEGRQPEIADRLRRDRARRHRQYRAALLGLRGRRARASASPTSCRWIRAGITTTPRSAWTGGQREADHAAHYPSIKPELVELTSALHGLAHDADKRAQYMADAPAYRGQVPAAAGSARGADQARPAGDREDGRASAGAVPGAIADPAPASESIAIAYQ